MKINNNDLIIIFFFSEIYLGNANGFVERSIVPDKGFISIEKPDKEGIATWRWFSLP
jgi:hypothetical protein